MTSNDDELTPLGRWIKATLEIKGKNQAWLAEKLDVSPAQVSRLMRRGGSEASPSQLDTIADALGRKRTEIYRAAGHIEPISPKDDVDESLLFQANRLPMDERERWVKRIELDANEHEQRKATKSASKARS